MYFNVKPTKFPIKYCVTLENMLPLYTIFFLQMVCDPNFRETSVCAKWPGSVHYNSRIFRTGGLCQQFENGYLISFCLFLLVELKKILNF